MEFLLTTKELEREIFKIQKSFLNKLIAYKEIIEYCSDILELYRKEIREFEFVNITTEIQFFKMQKSVPLTFMIYYQNLLLIDMEMPSDEISRHEFLLKKNKEIYQFFMIHKNFGEYISLDEEYMDEFYFTRKYFNNSRANNFCYHERDPKFSTTHDLLYCQIKAKKSLLNFLNNDFSHIQDGFGKTPENPIKLNWTESKVALTELIYALQLSGAINHGNTSIKELISIFETLTGIEMSDYPHTFLRMRERNDQLKFLNKMSQILTEYIQNLDD